MRDVSKMRMVVAIKPDNAYPYEKLYSWALQLFSEADKVWSNVSFGRCDTRDEAWSAAGREADKIELEYTGKLTPPREKLKLIPARSEIKLDVVPDSA